MSEGETPGKIDAATATLRSMKEGRNHEMFMTGLNLSRLGLSPSEIATELFEAGFSHRIVVSPDQTPSAWGLGGGFMLTHFLQNMLFHPSDRVFVELSGFCAISRGLI
jgi:hypothetical protein